MIRPDVSIVVPLLDEEASIVPMYQELAAVLNALRTPYEMIFIDDGSTDTTFAKLSALQASDPSVAVIRFTRNFGQTAAFAAGFARARGKYVVTLDGDLQNDPRDIPAMLALAATADIVSGWRRKRQDSFLTRYLPSAIANWLIGIVTGVHLHDNGCSLKVYRAEVVKPLRLRPGMHRYLPALASQLGSRVSEIEVNHRARQHGRSKYTLARTFRVAADLITMRRLMREAVDPATDTSHLFEIAEIREATKA